MSWEDTVLTKEEAAAFITELIPYLEKWGFRIGHRSPQKIIKNEELMWPDQPDKGTYYTYESQIIGILPGFTQWLKQNYNWQDTDEEMMCECQFEDGIDPESTERFKDTEQFKIGISIPNNTLFSNTDLGWEYTSYKHVKDLIRDLEECEPFMRFQREVVQVLGNDRDDLDIIGI